MPSDEKARGRLSRRLRHLRAEHGLSQLDIVRTVDISLSHYQKIERGVLDVRLSTLSKLASCFGLTVSDLLRDV
jgi:transcriptional regulator with XRE-family HTH domain